MENHSAETMKEDIVIVGAGIAGLSTALGLHRLGLKSMVLEASDSLRVAGFALLLWTNAWRALDALGVADSLRKKYPPFARIQVASGDSQASQNTSEESQYRRDYEGRCVQMKDLLETMEKELPNGTIRYSSEVVLIEDSRYHKLLHMADCSTIQTKVLIGCDGVNSMVSKLLGLQRPVHSGRSAVRGFVELQDEDNILKQCTAYFGGGVRFGFAPSYGNFMYWFCTYYSSAQDKETEDDPVKIKQFVLSKISKVPGDAADIMERIVESTELGSIFCSPLKLRMPWNLLTGNIARNNMAVAGDALHPMTSDTAQGGCSALEDGVILARFLGEAFLNSLREENMRDAEEEYESIRKRLKNYADGRRWRSFFLISTAFVMGIIQQSDSKLIKFLQEKFLPNLMINTTWKMADYDCGELVVS